MEISLALLINLSCGKSLNPIMDYYLVRKSLINRTVWQASIYAMYIALKDRFDHIMVDKLMHHCKD